ncbi:MAG: hypothetical protein ACRC2T_13185 [Thermoguttaceae bacterium]
MLPRIRKTNAKSIAVLFVALLVILIQSLTSYFDTSNSTKQPANDTNKQTNNFSVSGDRFVVGDILTKSEFYTAKTITVQELYKKTIGEVSEKSKRKYKTVQDYVTARGEPSLAGKAFEALTVQQHNDTATKNGSKKLLVSTASLNRPTDAADLLLVSESGEILGVYQLKAGRTAAVEAVSDPKYNGMTVVTHPERLAVLQKDLDKNKAGKLVRLKPLSPYWSKIDEAISSGKLTSEINQITVPTYEESLNAGKVYVEKAFK